MKKFFSTKTIMNFLLVLMMAIVGCVGQYTNFRNGLYSRLDSEAPKVYSQITNNYSTKSYVSDICHHRYPTLKEFHSCLLSKDSPAEVAIIGDSHALQYYESLISIWPNKSILNVSEFICLPFVSNWILDNYSHLCRNRIQTIKNLIEENHRISTYILVGRWNTLISFDGKFRDPQFHYQSTSEYLSFKENGSDILNILTSNQKSIILIQDNPELDVDPRKCIRSKLKYSIFGMEACSVNRIKFEQKISFSENALREILVNFSNVLVYNPREFLCNRIQCPLFLDDKIVYFDRNHLTRYGADTALHGFNTTAFKVR